MNAGDLFGDIPSRLPEELFTPLWQADGIRVERIVSRGHASPPDFWYDQDESEWVLVLQGSAVLQLEGNAEPIELRPGSYVNIPAHAKHRVVSTSSTENTVWLAIHYG
jgi:cupin 2 domain-containing protein